MKNKKTKEPIKVRPQAKPPINKSSNTPYLIAIVVMILLGIAGVAAIVALRPEADIFLTGAMVFGFITPTTLSLLSLMKAQETHLSVNSRLDGFIRNAENAARGEGREEGRVKANKRTDDLAGKK